ncbi:MAG: hypothetical protein ACRDBY_14280 [Cetobacterium sp.]
MGEDRELEELTLKFLQENDDYYTSKKINKRTEEEYPYLTNNQKRYNKRKRREYNFSEIVGHTVYISNKGNNIDLSNYK